VLLDREYAGDSGLEGLRHRVVFGKQPLELRRAVHSAGLTADDCVAEVVDVGLEGGQLLLDSSAQLLQRAGLLV
jgi:hypothetical protein